MTMCQVAKEAVWLTGLPKDLGLDLRSALTVYGDNQGALALTQNPVFRPHSKHTAGQYHFTRELVQTGQVVVNHISYGRRRAYEGAPPSTDVALTEMMGVYERN